MSASRDYQIWLRGKKLQLYAIFLLIALPMSGVFVAEYVASRPPVGSRLVHGVIISRTLETGFLGSRRPVLMIKIDGSDEIVSARLGSNSNEDIPDLVSFYYGGDASREVFLQQEDNPLFIALFFFFAPMVGIGVISYMLRRKGPTTESS